VISQQFPHRKARRVADTAGAIARTMMKSNFWYQLDLSPTRLGLSPDSVRTYRGQTIAIVMEC
jgi:hypothetical protein